MDEANRALLAGYANRMMLKLSPELSFGVLSPAFRGCEGGVALNRGAGGGCNFLKAGHCQLHGTGFQPLECHWHTPAGQALVRHWAEVMGYGPDRPAGAPTPGKGPALR